MLPEIINRNSNLFKIQLIIRFYNKGVPKNLLNEVILLKFKKLSLSLLAAFLLTGVLTACADQNEVDTEENETETPAETETEETNE